AVAQAALNLSYTIISSPIDGRIGAITLTEGNLVTPSTPPLATVNQLDPIRVVFSVADRTLVSVQQRTGTTAQQVSQGLVVNLILPNGTTYAHPGRIAFLGNEVDRQTGTVSVYAEFPNPDALLLPGAFVRVRVHREAPQQRPLVPAAAVQTDRSGDFVLVVGQGNKVVQTPVKLGRQIDQEYIVEDGLSGGERVIIAGSQKVQPGQTVAPSVATPTASQPSTAGQEG
ncbi:MAG: efflux RND transporter periplasmic adaptor subunit, partial [Acetobacteraceae bacterium]